MIALSDLWAATADSRDDETGFYVRQDDRAKPNHAIINRIPRSIPELRLALRLYRLLVEQNATSQADQLFRSMMVGLDRLG